jgi:DNA-binding LacI/PurR family transcriptional regulator
VIESDTDIMTAIEPKLRQASGGLAVYAYNDDMALRVLAALVAAGIDVPGDVAIIGTDGSAAAYYSRPQLTTVALRPEGLGSVGDAMHATLEGRRIQTTLVLDAPVVVVGGTT